MMVARLNDLPLHVLASLAPRSPSAELAGHLSHGPGTVFASIAAAMYPHIEEAIDSGVPLHDCGHVPGFQGGFSAQGTILSPRYCVDASCSKRTVWRESAILAILVQLASPPASFS